MLFHTVIYMDAIKFNNLSGSSFIEWDIAFDAIDLLQHCTEMFL